MLENHVSSQEYLPSGCRGQHLKVFLPGFLALEKPLDQGQSGLAGQSSTLCNGHAVLRRAEGIYDVSITRREQIVAARRPFGGRRNPRQEGERLNLLINGGLTLRSAA